MPGSRFRRAEASRATEKSRAQVRALCVECMRVLLAAPIATLVLIAVNRVPVPANASQLAASPYWATLAHIGMVVVIWFLAGPTFTGRGKDVQPDRRQIARTAPTALRRVPGP